MEAKVATQPEHVPHPIKLSWRRLEPAQPHGTALAAAGRRILQQYRAIGLPRVLVASERTLDLAQHDPVAVQRSRSRIERTRLAVLIDT
jgi:hypothetical protein